MWIVQKNNSDNRQDVVKIQNPQILKHLKVGGDFLSTECNNVSIC